MNKSELVKKNILFRKLNEYFKKNPKSKSVIVNSGAGATKTIWRAVKEGKDYIVTEVNTRREKFILEAVGGQTPAAGSTTLGGAGGGGKGPGLDSMSASELLSLVQSGALKVTQDVMVKALAPLLIPKDANLKKQLKSTFDILNQARNKDPSAGGFLGSLVNLMNTPEWLRASKNNDGEKLSEDDTSIKQMKQTEPEDETIGMDQEKDDVEPQTDDAPETDDPTDQQDTQEEIIMKKSLEGKPIQSIDVDHRDDGTDVIIKVAGSDIPSKFEFYKDGKVIYSHKDRPYILKRT